MRVFLLSVMVVIAGCRSNAEVPRFSITGRVLATDADLSQVRVSLDGEAPVSCDDLGDFRIDGVFAGPHVVAVSAEFSTLEGRVGRAVVVGEQVTENLLFELTPIGRVSGQVWGPSGEAVMGARVFAAGSAALTFSQIDGAFVLDRVPLSARTIVATAVGYEPAQAEVVAWDDVVRLDMAIDLDGDPNAPNGLPLIEAFEFFPSDRRGDNPFVVPVADGSALFHPGSAITLRVRASDPDGDALSYAWSVDKGTLIGGNQPDIEWVAGDGDAEVVLVVFDSKGGSSTARQRFLRPARSIRGAAVFGSEIIYSESRTDNTRDLLGFDLASNHERLVYGGADEQHAPRVLGDLLVFADQVFTFVQPTVFRLHTFDLKSGDERRYGQVLAPDDYFSIDYRLYSPLSGGRVTYYSYDGIYGPPGLGAFDPATGTYQSFDDFETSSSLTPRYPCFVFDGTRAFSIEDGALIRYTRDGGNVTRSLIALLPGGSCAEMQVDANFAVLRLQDVFDPLTLVNIDDGVVRQIGTGVRSFVLDNERLAYSDKRGGFTGVFIYDLNSEQTQAVPVRGFYDRRVLALHDDVLVYGEQANESNVTFYSSENVLVYRLK